MAFIRTMRLRELEGIINNHCLVSIREAGTHGKYENFMVSFLKALDEFGDYVVWFIDPISENMLDIIVSEDEP